MSKVTQLVSDRARFRAQDYWISYNHDSIFNITTTMRGLPKFFAQLSKEHICITHGYRQCGDGQREGGPGAGRRWAKGGEWGHLQYCQ